MVVRKPERLPALDGLRGICASMIVLYHVPTQGMIGGSALIKNGFLFVDFFFVLSGFVIFRSSAPALAHDQTLAGFLGRRLSRVFPLHCVMMLLYLAFNIATGLLGMRGGGRSAFTYPDDLGNFLLNLFFLQNFWSDRLLWNVPTWSVAAEVWTYLIFGAVMRWWPRQAPRFAATMMVVAVGCLLAMPGHQIGVYHFGAIIRAVLGFSIGVLIAQGFDRARALWTDGVWPATAVECATVSIVILFVAIVGGMPYWSLIAPILFGATILIFALERGLISRMLATRPLVAVGHWSYAIYIGHFLIVQRLLPRAFAKLLGPTWRDEAVLADIASCIALATVIVVAWAVTRWIEPSAVRLFRRLAPRRRGKDPASPPTMTPAASSLAV